MEIFGIKITRLNRKEILNIIVFLALLILTLRETATCFQRYLEFPKYTSFQLVYQEKADFPSLTFCPLENEVLNEKELKASFMITYYDNISRINKQITLIAKYFDYS